MEFLRFLSEITSFWTSFSPYLSYTVNSTHVVVELENGFNRWVEGVLKDGYPFEVTFRFRSGEKTFSLKRIIRFSDGLWVVQQRWEGVSEFLDGCDCFKSERRLFTRLSDAENYFSRVALPVWLFSGNSSLRVSAFITSCYPLVSSPRLWGGTFPEAEVRFTENN